MQWIVIVIRTFVESVNSIEVFGKICSFIQTTETDDAKKYNKKLIAGVIVFFIFFVCFLAAYTGNRDGNEFEKIEIIIKAVNTDSNFVENGGTITYTVTYPNDKKIEKISLQPEDIVLYGFDADVAILGEIDYERKISLTNVRKNDSYETNAYIGINAGTAKDIYGNETKAVMESEPFVIGDEEMCRGSAPSVTVSEPSKKYVIKGGYVEFLVSYANWSVISLKTTDIGIAPGVQCDIDVLETEEDKNCRIVRLSNIQSEIGKKISIALRAGTAANGVGKSGGIEKSISFKLVDQDMVIPGISISLMSNNTIKEGDSVEYRVIGSDNQGIARFSIDENELTLVGFDADIYIINNHNDIKLLFDNVRKNSDYDNGAYVHIPPGVVVDYCGNMTLGISGERFFIE